MTDMDIKKALECCKGDDEGKNCFDCPLYEIDDCQQQLNENALDYINRLEAENEDIKFLYKNLKEEHLEIIKAIKHTKAEAYKEFAERLKENSIATFIWKGVVMVEEIDNLLKEMVGE